MHVQDQSPALRAPLDAIALVPAKLQSHNVLHVPWAATAPKRANCRARFVLLGAIVPEQAKPHQTSAPPVRRVGMGPVQA